MGCGADGGGDGGGAKGGRDGGLRGLQQYMSTQLPTPPTIPTLPSNNTPPPTLLRCIRKNTPGEQVHALQPQIKKIVLLKRV